MDPERLAQLRRVHTQRPRHNDCQLCVGDWPCETAQLLALIDAGEYEVTSWRTCFTVDVPHVMGIGDNFHKQCVNPKYLYSRVHTCTEWETSYVPLGEGRCDNSPALHAPRGPGGHDVLVGVDHEALLQLEATLRRGHHLH